MSLPEELSNVPLLDLFRSEVESQAAMMTAGLLALERDPSAAQCHEEIMRGAHSVKGAARIVNREMAARLAHAMEECFVTARREGVCLTRPQIDELLRGVDLLRQLAQIGDSELPAWEAQHSEEIERLSRAFGHVAGTPGDIPSRSDAPPVSSPPAAPASPVAAPPATRPALPRVSRGPGAGRALRVSAANLDRLLGLAGESLVASRWVNAFATSLLRLKRQQNELSGLLSKVTESLAGMVADDSLQAHLAELQQKAAASRDALAVGLEEIGSFDRRFSNLSQRLHHEVLDCRMRPFVDGARGFPRIARDVARELRKEARLEIVGESTQVDREILERMESSLGHLVRNAIDHGIEHPDDRERSGKPREGTVRVEARHSGGMLLVEVSDDGRGIDLEELRAAVLRKALTSAEVVAKLSDSELLEFVFLPGFTMKETVTEISGRGVGLDAVKTTVKELGGAVRVSSQAGRGTVFQLSLPLTLSVLRALLTEIAGEPYAFPLARISGVVKVAREDIQSIEGREHFTFGGGQVGLIPARQLLALGYAQPFDAEISVILIGEKSARYGLVVDRFLGERELVVHALDARLGKVKDVSAAAILPDQSTALIIDVDDLLRSTETLVSGGRIQHVRHGAPVVEERKRKRVLVVDDSLTVRELERKLIESKGYDVVVAVDGMDGWNAIRTGHYDLVVTDIDMPRLDGIELVSLIKKDPRLQSLPVMIVSYKDREEDRRRGLEAGADFYLTKGSFHDETLLRAVADLIGEGEE